jgi:hypothetical protein
MTVCKALKKRTIRPNPACDEHSSALIQPVACRKVKRGRHRETLAEILLGSIFVFILVMTIRTCLQVSLGSAWPSFRSFMR